jgi:uncharacterized protein YacL
VIGAALGVVGGFALGYGLVQFAGTRHGSGLIIGLTTLEGLIFAYLGTPYVVGGWRNFNARLRTTPLPDLMAALAGIIVGLVIAVLIGFFMRDFVFGIWLSAILAALLAYAGATIGMNRRHELMSLLGLGGEPGAKRRIKGVLVDTSVIIDGRILDVVRTGFLDVPLILTQSVLREMQWVADAADPRRRARGRRGLEILTQLQQEPLATLVIHEDDTSGRFEIDDRLVRLAKSLDYAILTNDFNLNRVARLEGVTVLNLNELVNALKTIAIPGEAITVSVVREGREAGQGVAYLDDGTMVVVEGGSEFINQTIAATVTSILQTAAGRMIFAEPEGSQNGHGPRRARRPAPRAPSG